MPQYNITSPDGRKLRITAPEGATQEQVLAYAQSNMAEVFAPNEAPKNTMLQNIGNVAGRTLRAGVTGLATPATMIADPFAATLNYATGQNLPLPSQRLQQALTDLGVASPQTPGQRIADSAATAISGAGGMIGVGRAISRTAPNAAMQTVRPVAQEIGAALSAAPISQAGAAMGSAGAGQSAREAGAGPGAEILANLVGGSLGGRAAGAIANRLGAESRVTPPRQMTSEDFRNQSRQSYEAARQSGASITAPAATRFIDESGGLGLQTEAGRIVQGADDPFTAVYGRMSTLRNRPMSIDEIDDIDKVLTRRIDSFTELGRVKAEGLPLLRLRDEFRGFVSNLKPDDVTGGAEGFDALKNARADWARSMRVGEVERIMGRQGMYPQDSTAVQTGFRSLYQNRDKMAGFSPDERAAIRRAGSTAGPVMEAVKPVSSRLFSIITGATGGVPGYLSGLGVSAAGRAAVDAIQMRRAQEALDIISRSRPMEVFKHDPQLLARMVGIAVGGNQ